MSSTEKLGGIIHTYQKYDPINVPSPRAEAPDLASPAMEHLLFYGNTRRLTEEELANAVEIDPTQIRGMGPSLDALKEMLEERKRKILQRYESKSVQEKADKQFQSQAKKVQPPGKLKDRYQKAVKEEQIYDLERLFYSVGDDRSPFAGQLVQVTEALAQKYQIDQLSSKYEFTGKESMSIPQALDIKQELEEIDNLLKQLEEAKKNAKIGIIDMEALSQYADANQMEDLKAIQEQINEYLRQQAEQQGIQQDRKGFQLTPKAYRLFQSRVLSTIFAELQAGKTGKHQENIIGEGATELQKTRSYEFGDSITHMDIPSTMINAMLRTGAQLPLRLKSEDIIIHETRNTPKCATVVLLDMSGSMRYDGQYVNVKRMGLALEGLIRSEYPGDYLQFIEMFTFAKPRHISEIPTLMPKPVTVYDPVVRLRADMSDPDISELQLPPHFTNIQHAMQLGRQFLANQDTPNKQMVLITDGLPTAHFEGKMLYLLYPPDPKTENATMREAQLCAREGITINIFLLQSWNQSEEDVRFAYKMAEMTKGRVIFTAGRELDRFVVWDYIKRRRSIIA